MRQVGLSNYAMEHYSPVLFFDDIAIKQKRDMKPLWLGQIPFVGWKPMAVICNENKQGVFVPGLIFRLANKVVHDRICIMGCTPEFVRIGVIPKFVCAIQPKRFMVDQREDCRKERGRFFF